MDFEIAFVDSVFSGLKIAEKSVWDAVDDEAIAWFDAGHGIEYLEAIYGAAFMTAQAYLNSGYAGLKNDYQVPSKSDALRCFSTKMEKFDVTCAELVNAISNYYKHHDEWPNWDPVGNRKYTIPVLEKLGFNEKDVNIIFEAAKLFAFSDYDIFSGIRKSICDWRREMVQYVLRENKQTKSIKP